MNERERIRELAEQAGFVLWDGAVDWASNYDDALEKFAELVRADEREACAQVCEDLIGTRAMARHCADAIIARGEAEYGRGAPVVDGTVKGGTEYVFDCPRCGHCCPEHEWVGLHEHELQVLAYNDPSGERLKLAKAVEAKLKERNGG